MLCGEIVYRSLSLCMSKLEYNIMDVKPKTSSKVVFNVAHDI